MKHKKITIDGDEYLLVPRIEFDLISSERDHYRIKSIVGGGSSAKEINDTVKKFPGTKVNFQANGIEYTCINRGEYCKLLDQNQDLKGFKDGIINGTLQSFLHNSEPYRVIKDSEYVDLKHEIELLKKVAHNNRFKVGDPVLVRDDKDLPWQAAIFKGYTDHFVFGSRIVSAQTKEGEYVFAYSAHFDIMKIGTK